MNVSAIERGGRMSGGVSYPRGVVVSNAKGRHLDDAAVNPRAKMNDDM